MGTWTPGPAATGGADTYTGDGTNETVDGLAGNDILNGLGGDDTLNGGDDNDTLNGGAGGDILNGGNGDDMLQFSHADFDFDDQFNGGSGTDILSLSGTENTVLELGSVSFSSIEAITFNNSTAGFLSARISTSQIGAGISASSTITGFDGQVNSLRINMTAPGTFTNAFVYSHWDDGDITIIDGSSGVDTITGNAFDEILLGNDGADTINGNDGADHIEGGQGDDNLTGGEGNDLIVGGAGANIVHGGAGEDLIVMISDDNSTSGTIDGGADYDILQVSGYAHDSSFTLYDFTVSGFERVQFASLEGAGSYNTLNVFTSNLTAGFASALDVIGSDANDTINISQNGIGVINLAAWNFSSWTGDDTIQVNGNVGNDTVIGSSAHDVILGYDGNDNLSGGGGADQLYGGTGADTMAGGDGDDIYDVDNVGDVTSETSALGGIDTVESSVTRTLGANLENLTLTGASAINGFGNGLNNAITGNAAANQLNGFDGNDTLDGGAGADNMFGGNGNDVYYVDNAGDQTTETSALGGTDTVYSSVARNLTANIENLALTGAAAITGAGNTLNNIITGNSAANTLYGFDGNDRLDGGAGADTLFGANGDDTYVVDDVNDITVEGSPSGGIDTVESWISRNLNANFENLTLLGSATIAYGNVLNNTLNGNGLSNSLYGFDGSDTLNGGAGADNMFGGDGDDLYSVDDAGDVTSETSALGGNDTVLASVTRNLTANLENLVLVGNSNITGAGNALNNHITGNDGDNTLYGLAGADTLDGGLGADTLQGGADADTYVFSTTLGGGNVDAIVGFSVVDDTIMLDHAIFTGLSDGVLAASAFHIGASGGDADDHIIYDSATGALYWDADGTGGAAQIQFATLAAGLALTNNDFIVGG